MAFWQNLFKLVALYQIRLGMSTKNSLFNSLKIYHPAAYIFRPNSSRVIPGAKNAQNQTHGYGWRPLFHKGDARLNELQAKCHAHRFTQFSRAAQIQDHPGWRS